MKLIITIFCVLITLCFLSTAVADDLETELNRAAGIGNTVEVNNLLDKGADINAGPPDGESALMIAALGGHIDVVRVLIKRGANVNAKMRDGSTAASMVSKLLDGRVQIVGHAEVIQLLKDAGGSTEVVQDNLIKRKKDAQKDSNNLDIKLLNAASVGDSQGYADIVRTLIEKGANVNAKDSKGTTVLKYAIMKGNTEVVSVLLDKGATVDFNTIYMSFVSAALYNNLDIPLMLLDKFKEINARDDTNNIGYTILMYAVQFPELTKFVKVLVDRGADVNATDIKGATALMGVAKGSGSIETMRILLDKGADVNAKDTDGNTALMTTAISGRADIASLLLERGADVNAKNKVGETTLSMTNRIINGVPHRDWQKKIANILIAAGAK